MINPYSLLAMMQSGGNVPSAYRRSPGLTATAGGATLARALQRRSDVESLEEYQEAEAERQKRGGLAGKGLSFLGGLAGGALGGPAGAAIGSGLGQGFGERLFAGKARDVDRTGTVYGQQAFRDVEEASKDYQKGMMGRAVMSGVKTGLTAGLTPGGGVYGQYNPLTGAGRQGIKAAAMGQGVTGYAGSQGLSSFATPEYVTKAFDVPKVADASALLDFGYSKKFDPSSIFSQSSYDPMAALRGPRLPGGEFLSRSQDGGLIGMQYGGHTSNVADILEQAGLTATPEQLALFEQFDPTQLQNVTKGLQQSLLSGTQQGQQHQVTSGFGGMGATQYGQAQQRKAAGEQFTSAKSEAARAFESKTLGTAADLIAGGGEFGMVGAGASDADVGSDCYNDCIESGGTPSTCTAQCAGVDEGPDPTLSCVEQGLTQCLDPDANNYEDCGDCDYGE